MSKTYTIITGDTFDLIARKVYGSEVDSPLIIRSNPGLAEPLTPGVIIFIPDKPDAPSIVAQSAAADNEDEVAVSVGGERFRFWDSVAISLSMDALDAIEFSAPFEPGNAEFKEAFKPLSYKSVSVTIGGVPFFTGTMVGIIPAPGLDRNTVTVSGYALPGVLNDCNIPASAFPLEFEGQGLQDIATTIAGTFGLSVEFEEQQGAVFERVAAAPNEKAFQFLIKLHNLLI